jgi:hypothetical protein
VPHTNDSVDNTLAFGTQRSRMKPRSPADAPDGRSLAAHRSRTHRATRTTTMPSPSERQQLGPSGPWSQTAALGFAAYGAENGRPRLFYRGFAANPVTAMTAARHAEATALSAFGIDASAGCQFNLHFDEAPPAQPPLVTLISGEGEWPYELALVGQPLPVRAAAGQCSAWRRSAQTPAIVDRRIDAILRADGALARLDRSGTPITYRQSVGWWPGAELPRLHARFGLWTPDNEPVVVAGVTAHAVLETLLRSAALGQRNASVLQVMPRLWRPRA